MLLDPAGGERFDGTVALGSVIQVVAALGPPYQTRLTVFLGRVTDLNATHSPYAAGSVCQVVCTDAAADLDNRYIGDEPWPQETVRQRATRVLNLSGTAYSIQFDTRPADVVVSRMDVDRRGVYDLLTELAVTSGAILRMSVTSAGDPLVYFQDPNTRPSLYSLAQNPATNLWGVEAGAAGATPLSADEILLDPTHWVRDVTDLLTRASVGWLDQSGAPDPVERTVTVIDSVGEDTYGARAISVSTLLTTSAAATSLATALLASQAMGGVWRSTGLSWDLSASEELPPVYDARLLAIRLLDIKKRAGTAISLKDLPDWTPTGAQTSMYVEGGTYVYGKGADNTQGWTLALDTVPGAGGGGSVNYSSIGYAIRASDIDPALGYLDLLGVGMGVVPGPAWSAAGSVTWEAAQGDWYDWESGVPT
jgi:hypothetical protein